MARLPHSHGESDGTLQYIGIPAVTGPTFPTNYFSSFDGILTNDPTDHLAVMLGLRKFIPPDTVANEGCALASFTVGSKGQLTSTNTYANMPEVCGQSMLLSPSGKFLVVLSLGGRSLQLFHFNGSQPSRTSLKLRENPAGSRPWHGTRATISMP
jgi:hypothetical protein